MLIRERTAMQYTPEQRHMMLALARETLVEVTAGRPMPEAHERDPMYLDERGVFVTLTVHGELRGCLGFPEAQFPLGDAIIHAAKSAAINDLRFPIVTPGEVPGLRIEISVLSPSFPIDPAEVQVGVHGLIVQQGTRRGLLLPQVPVEHDWDRETFLCLACRKAGLPEDAWRKGASVCAFTAEYFHEEEETV
jgi:AmmeMemoRadiSam system protein A